MLPSTQQNSALGASRHRARGEEIAINESEFELPRMVRPYRSGRGELPIAHGPKRLLGMQIRSGDRKSYTLGEANTFFGRRVQEFPLTEQGWADCWRQFEAQDPEGARRFRQQSARAHRNAAEQRDKLGSLSAWDTWLKSLEILTTVRACTLVGGYSQDPLHHAATYDLLFTVDALLVVSGNPGIVHAEIPLATIIGLRVDGPGATTTGGGFVGGGYGVRGAVEGMVAASVLNSLTRKTTVHTLIEVQDPSRDFIFFHAIETPSQLHLNLMPVHAKLRSLSHQGVHSLGSEDGLDRLQKLGKLLTEGVLTQSEFDSAKASILGAL